MLIKNALGCKFTKLRVIYVCSYKCLNIVTNKVFDMLLEFLCKLLPRGKKKFLE